MYERRTFTFNEVSSCWVTPAKIFVTYSIIYAVLLPATVSKAPCHFRVIWRWRISQTCQVSRIVVRLTPFHINMTIKFRQFQKQSLVFDVMCLTTSGAPTDDLIVAFFTDSICRRCHQRTTPNAEQHFLLIKKLSWGLFLPLSAIGGLRLKCTKFDFDCGSLQRSPRSPSWWRQGIHPSLLAQSWRNNNTIKYSTNQMMNRTTRT